MVLAIDTSNRFKIKLALYWPEKMSQKLEFKSKEKSQTLLLRINRVLTENKVKLTDLKLIAVNSGPGSFTGLRVGATVANTLAYVLKIPVIGIKNQPNILKLAKLSFQQFKKGKIKPNSKAEPFYDTGII
ncbi:tRNA threonylcarbamoyl adenosine modification protein [subsurface metagenome]